MSLSTNWKTDSFVVGPVAAVIAAVVAEAACVAIALFGLLVAGLFCQSLVVALLHSVVRGDDYSKEDKIKMMTMLMLQSHHDQQ